MFCVRLAGVFLYVSFEIEWRILKYSNAAQVSGGFVILTIQRMMIYEIVQCHQLREEIVYQRTKQRNSDYLERNEGHKTHNATKKN